MTGYGRRDFSMAQPFFRLPGNQMAHDSFHPHKRKVDHHAANRGVGFAHFGVIIARVAAVSKAGAGDYAVRDKPGVVLSVKGLMAAECVPPTPEIRRFLICDYGFVLEVAEVKDAGLAAVHADFKRSGTDLQVLDVRTALMERRQIGDPLAKLTGIYNADAGDPQTGFYIGDRPHAPGPELIAGV